MGLLLNEEEADRLKPLIKFRLQWLLGLVIFELTMVALLFFTHGDGQFWFVFSMMIISFVAIHVLKRSVERTIHEELHGKKPEG